MYTDIHCHILHGVDDGADSYESMLKMLECAYKDGIRCICTTPHFNYTFYGDNTEKARARFKELKAVCLEKYPDMELYFGCEIFYHSECLELLREGRCPSIASTKYILCDFSHSVDPYTVFSAMKSFVADGYTPILAHAERYKLLSSSLKNIKELKESGVIIQVNAPSVIGKNSRSEKRISRKLIRRGLCDVVSTDAHNTSDRPFCMSECALYIQKHYGERAVRHLMHENAQRLLHGHKFR